MTDLYNVVVEGKISAGFENQEVAKNLAKIFKEPEEKMEGLLSGKQVIVKKKVDHELAIKITGMIEKAGAECKIVKQGTAAVKPLAMEKSDKSAAKPRRSKRAKSDKVSDEASRPQQSKRI
ncbi:MAG: hypothetical protein GY707_08045, partial [Desulfobacteraceae bacterium]|nr:hypothetical protein [Desulfobacteraceae bacterium]